MNSNGKLFRLAVVGVRIFLGVIFFTSGMGKLTRGDYPGLIGPVWLAERMEPYGLGLWAQFVGWSQVVIGLLLLSQRFATLGAIMLLPMIANILIVTVSLQWRGTPFINAFLLGLNLFLLAADYHRIKFLFSDDVNELRLVKTRRKNARADMLWLLAFALCLLSAALHPVSRWLTFGLSALGLLLFYACSKLRPAPSDSEK